MTTKEHPRPLTLSLTRTLAVHCFHAVGDVSFARQREDLRAIALFAIERGGALVAEEIHAALLPKLPVAASRRMLAVCEALGMVQRDRTGRSLLTEAGHLTAREGTVFVPERGAWTIWLTDDPLVPVAERLLRVEPFKEPDASTEGKERKDSSKRREFVKLPPWVQEATAAFASTPAWSLETSKAVRVKGFEPEVELAETVAALRLTVTLSPDATGSIELRGSVDEVQRARSFAPPPDLTFAAAWPLLLGARAQDWDGRSLAVSFDELTDTARERFVHALDVTMPPHRTWGLLKAAPVRGVPVRARTQRDAQSWAEWLVTNGISTYAPAARYREAWEASRARFAEHRIADVPQRDLAARFRPRAGVNPPRYWHLQAPTDWNL